MDSKYGLLGKIKLIRCHFLVGMPLGGFTLSRNDTQADLGDFCKGGKQPKAKSLSIPRPSFLFGLVIARELPSRQKTGPRHIGRKAAPKSRNPFLALF